MTYTGTTTDSTPTALHFALVDGNGRQASGKCSFTLQNRLNDGSLESIKLHDTNSVMFCVLLRRSRIRVLCCDVYSYC